MASERPEVSLVFPAYNEAESLVPALETALAYLTGRGLSAEVLVVDDGSRDDTGAVGRAFGEEHPEVRVLSHSPNRGKGRAVRRGMLAACGEFRVFMDVDLATPIEELDKLLEALQGGADVAIGTRYVAASQVEVRQHFIRRTMGAAFRALARSLLRLPISDFTCGFKGFRGPVADELFSRLTEFGWAFDAELLLLAARTGHPPVEVPVRWRDVRGSTVAPLSAAWESLRALLRIRANDRRGLYGQAQT